MSQAREDIKDFILANVSIYPANIVSVTAKQFSISRQRVHAYINREIENGKIIKVGRTSSTRYFLIGGNSIELTLNNDGNLNEDLVWAKYIKPMLLKYSDNVYSACSYGFTEILNNAIDHSEGSVIYVDVKVDNNNIIIEIMDNGVGIFQKIKDSLKLESIRESILHLSKGKFTTDPKNHTGQGIFFTSRIFDNFSIASSDLYYLFKDKGWFLSSEKNEEFGKGTFITMVISIDSKTVPKEIMDQYADEDIGFGKTIVAVALSADPKDLHVSRSQAKRLMMGLEKFKTIILDFKGVESVGQAFVDQIFRVFKNEYPNIIIYYFNANKEVELMIKRGLIT